MAIAVDSVVDGGNNGGSTNSLTFAFNNVAGNIVFVGVLGDNTTGGADDITGVTYNAVSMTLVNQITGENRFNYLYVLQNAPTGNLNVVINSTANHYIYGGAVSYSGAKPTGQPDANTTHLAPDTNALATSLASIADNCWHVLMEEGYSDSQAPTAGANTTRRTFDAAFGVWGMFDSNSAKTPAGSVTLNTDYPAGATRFAISHVMASFAPAIAEPALPRSAFQAVKRGAFY